MKNLLLIAGLFLLVQTACKDDIKELAPPASKVEGIKASWVLDKCILIDEQSLTRESNDITAFVSANGNAKSNITFTETNYTVDTAGLVYNVFESASGTWAFDNNSYPTKIILTPNNGNAFELPLGGPVRPTDAFLRIKKMVNCGTANAFSYNFSFIRK